MSCRATSNWNWLPDRATDFQNECETLQCYVPVVRHLFSGENLARLSMDPEYVVYWHDADGYKQRLSHG